MLPTVQTTDLAERRLDDGFERIRLTVTPVSPLNVGGLGLAAVVNNFSFRADKRLIPSVIRLSTLETTNLPGRCIVCCWRARYTQEQ